MKRVIIKDRGLMAQRLRQKMIEKGYVHKAGTPHQKMLAEAIGDTKIQPTISSILRQENESINTEYLKALCQALNCQEQWLLGGDYVPIQEKTLFKEELYQPEEKVPEKAENELLGTLEKISDALYMIMRQLQKMNKEEQQNG